MNNDGSDNEWSDDRNEMIYNFWSGRSEITFGSLVKNKLDNVQAIGKD